MRAAKEAKGLTKQVCKTKLHVCNNFSPFVFYTTLALSIVQKLENIFQVCHVLFSIRPCLCVLSLSFVYKCVTRYPCVTALQVLSTPGGSLGSGIGPHKDSTFSEHGHLSFDCFQPIFHNRSISWIGVESPTWHNAIVERAFLYVESHLVEKYIWTIWKK